MIEVQQVFNFKGYLTNFWVGANKDQITIVLTHDDGTSGNHLLFKFNDVPYAIVPIVNKEGLERMISALQKMLEDNFNENT